MRRNAEAHQRALARRLREDEAARLRKKVPTIESLKLEIEAYSPELPVPAVTYTRHIMVDRAPALFEIPCCDRHCRDGGHDITERVMEALERGLTRFEGEDDCSGKGKTDDCPYELHFVGVASYA